MCRENRLRERKSVFKEESLLFSKGAKKTTNNNNNNMAFTRGGPERGNPAMTTKRLRQGEKETHNLMLWEKLFVESVWLFVSGLCAENKCFNQTVF